MVPVFAPDGTLGDIPADRLQDAVKAGFKPGVNMTAPDGTKGVVPADRYVDAAKGGMKVDRIEDQPIQHPGFWHSLASDLVGMVKPGPGGGMSSPYPGVTSESGQLAWQNARVEAKSEADAGYSKPYMAAAGVARGLGVNVPGMEQSAKEGDAAGVLGHAAAVPVAMAATAGVAKGARLASDAAISPAGQAATDALKKLPASAISRIPYLGKVLEDMYHAGSEAMAKSRPAPPQVDSNLPAAPAREVLQARALEQGGKPVKDPSGGLGAIPVNTPAPEPVATGFNKVAVGKQLDTTLNQATGGKPLQQGVKLRDQLQNQPAATALQRNSAVVKDFKYDAGSSEMHVTTKDGVTYVAGDVTQAQADAFAAAESKGTAWQALRDNSTPVAKIINGKRISLNPLQKYRSASPDAKTDLQTQLEKSLEQALTKKAGR